MLRVLLGFALLLIGCLCSLSMSALYILGTEAPSAAFAEGVFCGSEGRLIDGSDAPAFGFAQVPACDSPEPEKAGSLAGRISLYIGISIALMFFGSMFILGTYISWKASKYQAEIDAIRAAESAARPLAYTRHNLSKMLAEGRISQEEYNQEMQNIAEREKAFLQSEFGQKK